MGIREHLAEVCESVEGALACTLMGFDGIEVDAHVQGGADVDMKSLLVEYSGVFRSAREAAEAYQAGGVAEVSIATDKVLAVARFISSEHFMVLALAPDGNVGKARFKLRVTAPRLRSEL
ncbi:MAG: hypothetical protein U0229_12750 [Anaeromyxobacter sp.]